MPPAQIGNAYLNFISSHDGIGMRPAEGVLTDKEIKKMLQRLKKNGSQFSMRKLSYFLSKKHRSYNNYSTNYCDEWWNLTENEISEY